MKTTIQSTNTNPPQKLPARIARALARFPELYDPEDLIRDAHADHPWFQILFERAGNEPGFEVRTLLHSGETSPGAEEQDVLVELRRKQPKADIFRCVFDDGEQRVTLLIATSMGESRMLELLHHAGKSLQYEHYRDSETEGSTAMESGSLWERTLHAGIEAAI